MAALNEQDELAMTTKEITRCFKPRSSSTTSASRASSRWRSRPPQSVVLVDGKNRTLLLQVSGTVTCHHLIWIKGRKGPTLPETQGAEKLICTKASIKSHCLPVSIGLLVVVPLWSGIGEAAGLRGRRAGRGFRMVRVATLAAMWPVPWWQQGWCGGPSRWRLTAG